jgi:hypothetical protein
MIKRFHLYVLNNFYEEIACVTHIGTYNSARGEKQMRRNLSKKMGEILDYWYSQDPSTQSVNCVED